MKRRPPWGQLKVELLEDRNLLSIFNPLAEEAVLLGPQDEHADLAMVRDRDQQRDHADSNFHGSFDVSGNGGGQEHGSGSAPAPSAGADQGAVAAQGAHSAIMTYHDDMSTLQFLALGHQGIQVAATPSRPAAHASRTPSARAATSITVSQSPDPAIVGQAVTFTATVIAVDPNPATPTGIVEFRRDDGTFLGQATLSGDPNNNQASLTLTASPANHLIKATYLGDANFDPSTTTFIDPVLYSTYIVPVMLNPEPSTYGGTTTAFVEIGVTEIAPVPPPQPTITGTLSFSEGGTPLFTTLVYGGGPAGGGDWLDSALQAGTHTIDVDYSGDANFAPCSGAFTHTVTKQLPSTTITSSDDHSAVGQPVTFTAEVTRMQPAPLGPSGTVTFSFADPDTPDQTVPLNGNTAQVTVSTLGVTDVVMGHTVAAKYNGDRNYHDSEGTLQQFVEEAALGSISGVKFEDMNGNGIKDAEDTRGLPGWTIQLTGEMTKSAVTGANGEYRFDNLRPGTYRIREVPNAVQQAAWLQTTVDPSDADLGPGQHVPDQNFGNFKRVTIKGQKFNDKNGDGVKGADEPGLNGWTITRTPGVGGSVTQSVDLDNNGLIDPITEQGWYEFTALGPGTYVVAEVPQVGWTQTLPVGSPPAGGTYVVAARSGQDRNDLHFGNTQLLIKSVEWIGLTSPLSANPSAGDGLRIFPDKQYPRDKLKRDQVLVRITLNQQVAGVEIAGGIYDVDDPSTNNPVIDNEALAADNRLDHILPGFTRTTNAAGVAQYLFDRVGMQPGDNYRVVAALAGEPHGAELEAVQNDGAAARVRVKSTGAYVSEGPGKLVASTLLTVWRHLHVEVDSMGDVAGNTVRGMITRVVADVGTSTVTTDQNLDDSVNRFENGDLTDSMGRVFKVIAATGGAIANTAGPNFTVTVKNRIDEMGRPARPAFGRFSLVDDDLLKDGQDVPRPDTGALDAALGEAYVKVMFDVGDSNDKVPFVSNVTAGTEFRKIIADNWTSRKENQQSFWVAYVLGAFQEGQAVDGDANTEGVAYGRTSRKGGSLIYIEANRDAAVRDDKAPALYEGDTVVHEVGHAVANSPLHPVTGGDSAPVGTYSKYTAAYLAKIRSSIKPWS